MTRMPDLERELVAAAQRRYEKAPRRRPSLRGLRLLAPVAAVLLLVVVAGNAFRTADPEIESPPAPAASAPTLEDLRRGPLGIALTTADPNVAPVSFQIDRWTVGAWGGPGGQQCHGAALRVNAAGESCSPAGTTAASLRHDSGATADMLSDQGSLLVYGIARPDVEAIEIEVGGVKRAARFGDRLLTVVVTDVERDAVKRDGGDVPPAGPVGFRLFAATFPDHDDQPAAMRIRRTDGRTVTVPLPVSGERR